MTIRNLSQTSFDDLLDCFLLAFENYFVEMPTDKNYYQQRWKAAKVNFELSYGMFDDGKLVAFIIHAVDKRNGIMTAFNTGTGVIPAYRGKKIVKSLYEYVIKDLVKNNISRSTLEVITKNRIAVRAYESVGFNIYKTYKCFGGTIQLEKNHTVELKEINLNQVDWTKLPNQELYSWDNQKEAIGEADYQFYQVLHNSQIESYFIINSERNYLAQFDLLNTENQGWNRLFSAIQQISSTIRTNNVDERQSEKIEQLLKVGLVNTVDQYEMELNISKL